MIWVDMTSNKTKEERSYWSRTQRLTLQLLALWFAMTFGCIFFARELSALNFFGWPLSFYLVAQGVVLLYTFIIWVYARKMKRIDQGYRGNNDVE